MPGLTLRPFRKGDEGDLAHHANNPRIHQAVRDAFPYPYTLKDARNWIAYCLAQEAGSNHYWAIAMDDRVIGGIGAIRSQDVYRYNAEVGYWLGESHWGKGYATQALEMMTESLFTLTDLHRLYAGVFSFNKASMRVLTKAGFHLEAIHRQAICKDHSYWDEYYFVKFRE
jgi:[ribosomal protein S5]-alanine N-acetyltransferase